MNVFLTLLFTLVILPSVTLVHAALPFGNGYYTNLCGTGTAATADTCNKGCNPTTGSCTSDKPYVIKWTCNGNVNECRLGESGFATTQNIGNTGCDQTVSIQVFNRNCRTYFGWICNETNMLDSMLWYSGSCQSPTPVATLAGSTGTPAAGISAACQELAVSAGNNASVPATVTFTAKTSAPSGALYRYYFGDGVSQETANSDVKHIYDASGPFTARLEVRDSGGVWVSAPRCETLVTVKPSTLETHKSDCSDLFIIDGNNAQAPATVSLRVTGFDNKGAIRKYTITASDNQVLENDSGAFQMTFPKAGTYTVRGSVTDSTGSVRNGGASCEKTVYIQTESLRSQPDTGTPTLYSVVALAAGVFGIVLLLSMPPATAAKRTPASRSAKKRARRTP